jgi:hypothetical protein
MSSEWWQDVIHVCQECGEPLNQYDCDSCGKIY